MIVYFSASARNLEEEIETYRAIVNKIHSLGHTVANEWVEPASHREAQGGLFKDIHSIVKEAQAGIESAEVLIAEASDGSAFGVGYELALALQRRKPSLILIKKEAANSSYAAGLTNELITLKKYDPTNLGRLIEDFIKANILKVKDLRFNFVIDRQIHNHLRLKSFRTGRTKAEVLRDLLLKDMENKS